LRAAWSLALLPPPPPLIGVVLGVGLLALKAPNLRRREWVAARLARRWHRKPQPSTKSPRPSETSSTAPPKMPSHIRRLLPRNAEVRDRRTALKGVGCVGGDRG